VTAGFRRLSERVVHQGKIWKVVVADFEAPDGTSFVRDIVRSPGAVGVVPLMFDAEGVASVVLVRQWRPALEQEMWEIPAGMRDVEGEAPEMTGRRELIEEVGYEAGALTLLTVMHPSAGLTDSTTHIFVAGDLRSVPRDLRGPEEEASVVGTFALDDALAMIDRSEITDAKTIVGLMLADRRLNR
jgi:8-oxo-dGTP pyrophosphatase MutT (NUDIX family)